MDQEYINRKVEQIVSINTVSKRTQLLEKEPGIFISESNFNFWTISGLSTVLLLLIFLSSRKYINSYARSTFGLAAVMVVLGILTLL